MFLFFDVILDYIIIFKFIFTNGDWGLGIGAYKEKIQFDINQEFAKRLAKNLYNYLDSFNQNQDQNKQLLIVPLNSLENWYNKFLNKYKIDPNFLMKSDS